jgi:hypothetical protein
MALNIMEYVNFYKNWPNYRIMFSSKDDTGNMWESKLCSLHIKKWCRRGDLNPHKLAPAGP